jgi:acetyl-CoA C-acetyltransferase
MVAVKNHYNGSMNPCAQYQFKVTEEAVVESVMVADPLRILDCSPITDGAAALVICSLETARRLKKPIVRITASAMATDSIALAGRREISWIESAHLASKKAYEMAGKRPQDMHVIEVHDCFTIAEIMVMEAIGLVEKGKGGPAVEAGLTSLGGKIPVNTSGGLKSKGHPVGATGVAQAIEIVSQLRGEAGPRQVKGATVGLAQNMGGSGGTSVVHIFELG